jgi:hypothetical protein
VSNTVLGFYNNTYLTNSRSSWALFNNASLNEVLSAGFWRGESSFLSHYLRSISVQADNLFSLGPIVSAQRVNFPPVSSDSGIQL